MPRGRGKIRIGTLGDAEGPFEMARNVRAGLLSKPKDLSPWPKYFYDEEGSQLFERITAFPEYYQYRAELSILKEKASQIVALTRCRELVELGSGSANKTRALLDAIIEAAQQGTSGGTGGTNPVVRYIPVDVSESALKSSAKRLLEEYFSLEILGFVGDFDRSLESVLAHLRRADGPDEPPGLVVFLGGTIGNFAPKQRQKFLRRLRAGLKEGDHLLVGVDLVKDARVLEAAYDDTAGVTDRFNKNLLEVLNRELGGRFDPELFTHRAFYDTKESRIEMWLYSKVDQKVPIAALRLEASFEVGEGMRTEISHKFTRPMAERMLEEAGFTPVRWHTDEERLFGLTLGRNGAYSEEIFSEGH